MTLTITPAMLAEVGACEDAKDALAERYPGGMPLTPEHVEVVLAHPEGTAWLDWLLVRAAPATVREQYEAAVDEAWAQYEAARGEAWAQYDAARAEAIRAACAAWAAMAEAP